MIEGINAYRHSRARIAELEAEIARLRQERDAAWRAGRDAAAEVAQKRADKMRARAEKASNYYTVLEQPRPREVLALLDENDELRRERDEAWYAGRDAAWKGADRAEADLAALRAEMKEMAAALEQALGLACGDPSNVIYNLEGALEDLDRQDADRICRSTIRRVGQQLADAARVLAAYRERNP